MLVELTVHNLVIVEHACLRLGQGLTVISGETGAGKSLLLDALDLLTGARLQEKVVGRWGEHATVTGCFQVGPERIDRLAAVLARDPGEFPEGQVILRRRISTAGRSQSWINEEPVTVAALGQAAAQLIAIHAQHEPIRLADPGVQRELLDAYGGLGEQAESYRGVHRQVLALENELLALDSGDRESLRELDYLRFQLSEIEALDPHPGDLAILEARCRVLSSAEELRQLAAWAEDLLDGQEGGVVALLSRCRKRLASCGETRLEAAAVACSQALDLIQEGASSCRQAVDALRADPQDLAQCMSRLDLWHDQMRKHGDGEAAVLTARERIAARIAQLAGLGHRRVQVVEELGRLRTERARLADMLSDARTAAFKRLARKTHLHLKDLGMPKAVLSLRDEPMDVPDANGSRRQEILVCTNPGSSAGTIREIASGGEASRLMLALAAALNESDPVPVLVFDEVDSGVGGRLGQVIGAQLAALARHRSVIAVTHTPQLAVAASRHYVVRKQQGERETRVEVEELMAEARIAEIAEMLGGGAAAVAQAKELMGVSQPVSGIRRG